MNASRKQRALQFALGSGWAFVGGLLFSLPVRTDTVTQILILALLVCMIAVLVLLSYGSTSESDSPGPLDHRRKNLTTSEALIGTLVPAAAVVMAWTVGFSSVTKVLMFASVIILLWLIVARDISRAFEKPRQHR